MLHRLRTLALMLGLLLLGQQAAAANTTNIALVRTELHFTIDYETDEPHPGNWIGVHPDIQADMHETFSYQYAPFKKGRVFIPAGDWPNGRYAVTFNKFGAEKPAAMNTFILPSVRFRVKTITLHNAREGAEYVADIGGLVSDAKGYRVLAYGKVHGPDWVTVDIWNGRIRGTPPEGSAGEAVVRIRVDAGWTSEVTVTIPIRKRADCLVQDVRLMTVNMWEAGLNVDEGLDKMIRAIITANVDVVGLSEAWHDRGSDVAKALGWFAFQSGEVLIMSRYPMFIPAKTISEFTVGTQVILDDHRQQLFVWNTNLKPAAPQSLRIMCDVTIGEGLTNLNRADDVRRAEYDAGRPQLVDDILNEMAWHLPGNHTVPVVFMGGWNSGSELDYTEATAKKHCGTHGRNMWPASRRTLDAGFIDSYREVHPDPVEDVGPTWSTVRNDTNHRLDFIYYLGGPNVSVIDSDTFIMGDPVPEPNHPSNLWPSDHAAVLTTLRLNDGTCHGNTTFFGTSAVAATAMLP